MADALPIGQTTVSVQHRCPRMGAHHRRTDPEPIPCDSCLSLIQTNVTVPYLPATPFTRVVEGLQPDDLGSWARRNGGGGYVVSDERLVEIRAMVDEDQPLTNDARLAGAVHDLLSERDGRG